MIFLFKFYTKVGRQEYSTGSKTIEAKNYDESVKKLNSLDLPMHTFSTVQEITNHTKTKQKS